ncbi:N-acetyltransferase family protein [Virgibacillus flavescens]|uniref:GNAT family N-acetyltransferase n=1 Tax=Virgibacillus flavescens TaxID=1611422 RepID=UPI003D32FFAA
MIEIRRARTEDIPFLMDMIYVSIHIPENKPSKFEVLNQPHIRKYHEGWGSATDRALIAFNEENMPVGAVWYRLFSEENQGYGYVDWNTPELGLAVTEDARGQGVATKLMEGIMDQAVVDRYTSISLSVDPTNISAVKLYQKLGFKKCSVSGTSWTMKVEL